MSLSLILANSFFCCLAALLLLPLLRQPLILTYKKGLPIFITIILILIKLLIPYEFSFTNTLASKQILPIIIKVSNIHLFKNITINKLFFCIWLLVAISLLFYLILHNRKLRLVLSIISETANIEITQILSEYCNQKNIKNKPKVIQLDIIKSPFIMGFHKQVIVLPTQLSKEEIEFILMHELEHLKYQHIYIKAIIEIIAIIYWWNPVIWLLRRELIRALELQADANVIKDLSNESSLNYLETLISISKKITNKQNTNFSLSFALKSSLVEHRIRTILASNYFKKNKKTYSLHFCLLTLSTILLLCSFIYTFESYNISPKMAEGTFTIDTQSDYLLLREDNLYDLYVHGIYVITLDNIPTDLSNLPVYK